MMPSPSALSVTLAHHRADRPFSRHRHEELVIVCSLRGWVREGLPSGEVEGGPLMIGVKAPGVWHTDHFAPHGATAVRVAVSADLVDEYPGVLDWGGAGWRGAGSALPAFARLAHAASRDAPREDLAWDAIAALAAERCPRGVPPAWLEEVRRQVEDDSGARTTLTTYAARAGVHPVYLARTFRRWYGCSVLSWRRRQRLGRAADRMARGQETLSRIAAAIHWCDQAAMCRAFARETGLTPGQYQSIVTRAT